jgi:hypothetical protein
LFHEVLAVALAIGIGCNVLIFIAAYFWVKYVPDSPTRQYGGSQGSSDMLRSPLLSADRDVASTPYPDAFGTPVTQMSFKVPGGYRDASNHGTPFRENSKL